MKQHSIINQHINSLKALLALSVMFISSPSFAQNSAADHIHNEKSATYDYATGQGLITLESYVDGEIIEKPFGKAVDIVLVLDVSNSMCSYNSGNGKTETVGKRVYLFGADQIGYLHLGTSATDNNTTTHDYKKTNTIDGKTTLRYTIQLEGDDTLYNLAYFIKSTSYGGSKWGGDTGWYYGTSTTLTQDTDKTRWTKYTANSANDKIYTDVKLDILENACRQLIETIYANPVKTGTGHKISVVTWADNNNGNANIHYVNLGLTEATAANKETLINSVTFLETGPNTYAKRGLDKAYTNLSGSSSGREKVVLFFTDGEPNNKFSDIFASAKNLKDIGAKVFSVGLLADDGVSANPYNRDIDITTKQYLECVSSLYANPTITSGKSAELKPGTKNTDGVEYYHWSQTGDDLADTFIQMGNSFTGGAGAEDLDPAHDVFMRDKINMDNCVLVDTTTAGAGITTYVAACTGKKAGSDTLTFKDKADWIKIDSLTVKVNATNSSQSIDIEGFDYSGNWCGYDAEKGEFRGYKLIVTIPFKMKAPGDEKFDLAKTNLAGSSLYKGKEAVGKEFPIPEIEFTEVTIQKYGLKAGDSAVYIVKKGDVEITRVVLTGTDDDGSMVSTKLRILEPGVKYSVTETWWDYTYTLTSSDVRDNVFIFNSKKRSGTENEAEHRKVNEFYK